MIHKPIKKPPKSEIKIIKLEEEHKKKKGSKNKPIITIDDSPIASPLDMLVESEGGSTFAEETSIFNPGFTIKDFAEVPEVPVYQCSAEEFEEPIVLIQKLRELGYEKYGCVKLLPPKSFNPPFSFDGNGKLMTTRKQVLQQLTIGKYFDQNYDAYTPEQFQELAEKFSRDYKMKTSSNGENLYRNNEYEYWSIIGNPEEFKEPVEVEYAADIASNKFGSAFPVLSKSKEGQMVEEDAEKNAQHKFNLNYINTAKNSLLQHIKYKKDSISGITSPWLYLGMLFATFCWHVEDNYMYSINYMHKGAAKTWYIVPGEYQKKFEFIIKLRNGELFARNPYLLYSICLMMNPIELKKANIPFYRTEQKAGEYILTFPKAYHAGFSHGFNVGEAVNIASADWIEYCKEALRDYAADEFSKKASFTQEWIVLQNARKILELAFTKQAKKLILAEYKDIKSKELSAREMIMRTYRKVPVEIFADKECRYDLHVCSQCENYTYLSYLFCKVCKMKACTRHVSACACLNPKICLNVRFTDEELQLFESEIKKSITKQDVKLDK